MIDEDDCGAIGGMKIGRGNRSTGRKPVPVPFVHHKSHMTWPELEPRAAAVGSQRLTAWATARPALLHTRANFVIGLWAVKFARK
jgi:hypothetical protein